MNELSEFEINKIPLPFRSYARLLIEKRSPYFDVVDFLLKEFEFHYKKAGQSQIVYMINPRLLAKQVELLVEAKQDAKQLEPSVADEYREKLTSKNVCNTILAFFHICEKKGKLKKGEDFYATTVTSGRKNYHVKIDGKTLNVYSKMFT